MFSKLHKISVFPVPSSDTIGSPVVVVVDVGSLVEDVTLVVVFPVVIVVVVAVVVGMVVVVIGGVVETI